MRDLQRDAGPHKIELKNLAATGETTWTADG